MRSERWGVWGRMDTCMCMAESLHSSPENVTTFLMGCTPIQNKKGFVFFIEKKKKRGALVFLRNVTSNLYTCTVGDLPIYKKHQRDTAATVNSNIFKCSFLNQKWKLSGVLFILTVLWEKKCAFRGHCFGILKLEFTNLYMNTLVKYFIPFLQCNSFTGWTRRKFGLQSNYRWSGEG